LVKLLLPGDFLVIANAAYHTHWSRRFAKAVLVDADAGPKCWDNAVKAAREAVDAGRRVCVLIDAHLTVPGAIHALNLSLTESTVPVHPFLIDGPWGNRFRRGPSDYVLPRRGKAPVSITLGPAISAKTQPAFAAAMRD